VIEGLAAGKSQEQIAKELGVSVKTITRDSMKVDKLSGEAPKNLELITKHREEIRVELLRLKELVLQSEQLDDIATVQAILLLNKQLIDLMGLNDVPLEDAPLNFDCHVTFGPDTCPNCGHSLDATAPLVIQPYTSVLPLPQQQKQLEEGKSVLPEGKTPEKTETTVDEMIKNALSTLRGIEVVL
jgi:hypothetical protein